MRSFEPVSADSLALVAHRNRRGRQLLKVRIRVMSAKHKNPVGHLHANVGLRAAGVAPVESGHGAVVDGGVVLHLVVRQSSHGYIQACKAACASAEGPAFTSG